jgi:hypothetical protein
VVAARVFLATGGWRNSSARIFPKNPSTSILCPRPDGRRTQRSPAAPATVLVPFSAAPCRDLPRPRRKSAGCSASGRSFNPRVRGSSLPPTGLFLVLVTPRALSSSRTAACVRRTSRVERESTPRRFATAATFSSGVFIAAVPPKRAGLRVKYGWYQLEDLEDAPIGRQTGSTSRQVTCNAI